MASVKVDQNWIKYERATVLVPKQLLIDLRKTLNGEMRTVAQKMRGNVSGTILNKRSGNLYKAIGARSRVYNNAKVWARAGTKYYIGRFWEGGFNRYGRQYAPRQWAAPVVAPALARIAGIMEQTIQKTYRDGGL